MRLVNIEIDLWPFRSFICLTCVMCIMKAKLSICRVHFPLTANRAQISETGGKARVPKWTSLNSFNLLWLLWAICGGFFITNFLLSNWLTMLVMPVFDKPVDIAQVIININLYFIFI